MQSVVNTVVVESHRGNMAVLLLIEERGWVVDGP